MNTLAAARRLAQCRPYRTDDLDAARAHISKLFKPHDLTIVGPKQKLDVCIGGGEIDAISLIYHRHGARVKVKPGPLENFYLLQIPLRGHARARVGVHDVRCGPGQAVMISPTMDVDMEFTQGCEQLILRVDANCFERFLDQQACKTRRRPLEFAPGVDLSGITGVRILALLEYVASLIHAHDKEDYPPAVRSGINSLLLGTLVSSLEHNYRDELGDKVGTPKPHHLKQAIGYMENAVRNPITPEDVAAAINVSPRTLFGSFKHYLDTTPMRHLKNLRLDKARERLLAADPSVTSVTAVAMEFCFQHFGHFSAAYKERFGELPSDTLGRRGSIDRTRQDVVSG